MSATGFRYGLEALLRMRDAELGRAREELAAARGQLEERSRELREQLDRLLELEQRGRDLIAPGSSIDLDAAQRVQRYLALERLEARRRQVELDRAKQAEAQALERWRAARQSVEILHRHRDTAAATFAAEELRRELWRSDELYLLRRKSPRSGSYP